MPQMPPFPRMVKETYVPPPQPIPFKDRRNHSKHNQDKTADDGRNITTPHAESHLASPVRNEFVEVTDQPSRSGCPSPDFEVLPPHQQPLGRNGEPGSVLSDEIEVAESEVIRNVLDKHMDMILAAASRTFLERAAELAGEVPCVPRSSSRQRNLSLGDGEGSKSPKASIVAPQPASQQLPSMTRLLGLENTIPEDFERASTETPTNQILDERDAYQAPERFILTTGMRKTPRKSTLRQSTVASEMNFAEPRDSIEESDDSQGLSSADTTELEKQLAEVVQKMENEIEILERRSDLTPKRLTKEISKARKRKSNRHWVLRTKFSEKKSSEKIPTSTAINSSERFQEHAVTPAERPLTPSRLSPVEEEEEIVSPIRSFKDFEEEIDASGSERSFSSSTAAIFKSTLDATNTKKLLRPSYAKCVEENTTSHIKVLVPFLEDRDDYEHSQDSGSFPTPPSSQPPKDIIKEVLAGPAEEPGSPSPSSASETMNDCLKNSLKRKRSPSLVELPDNNATEDPGSLRAEKLDHKPGLGKSTGQFTTSPKAVKLVQQSAGNPDPKASSSELESDSDSSLPSLRKLFRKTVHKSSTKNDLKNLPLPDPISSDVIKRTSPAQPNPFSPTKISETKRQPNPPRPRKKQRFSSSIEIINGTEVSPNTTRKSPTPFVSSYDFLKRRKSSFNHRLIIRSSDSDNEDGSESEDVPGSDSDVSFSAFDDGSPSPLRMPKERTVQGSKDSAKKKAQVENDAHTKERGGKGKAAVRLRAKTAPPEINRKIDEQSVTTISSSKDQSSGSAINDSRKPPSSSAPSKPKDIESNPPPPQNSAPVLKTSENSKPGRQTPFKPPRLSSAVKDNLQSKLTLGSTKSSPCPPPNSVPVSSTSEINKQGRQTLFRTPGFSSPLKYNLQPSFPLGSTTSSFSPSRPHPSSQTRHTPKKQKHSHQYSPNKPRTPNRPRNFTAVNRSFSKSPNSQHKSPHASSSNSLFCTPLTPQKNQHIRFHDDDHQVQANAVGSAQKKSGKENKVKAETDKKEKEKEKDRSRIDWLKRREVGGLPRMNSPTPLREFVKRECYGGMGKEN